MSLYHTRSKYDDDDTNALRNVVAAFENLNNQMGAIKGFKKNQKRCDCDEKLEKERGIK